MNSQRKKITGFVEDDLGENVLANLEQIFTPMILINLRDSFDLKMLTELIENGSKFDKQFSNEFKETASLLNNLLTKLLNITSKEPIDYIYRNFFAELCAQRSHIIKEINDELIRYTQDSITKQDIKRLSKETVQLSIKYKEKEMETLHLQSDLYKYLIENVYKNCFLKKFFDSKISQEKHKLDMEIKKLEQERDHLRSLIVQEGSTFQHQLHFISQNNAEIRDKIETVCHKQEKKAYKIDYLLHNAKLSRNEIYHKYERASEILEEHKNWVLFTRRTDAAIIIQTFWRKILAKRAIILKEKLARMAKKQKLLEKQKLKKAILNPSKKK